MYVTVSSSEPTSSILRTTLLTPTDYALTVVRHRQQSQF